MSSVIQEPPVHPLETYIRELRDIRASGAAVAETSYYGPLATLLNDVGKSLKPKVRCIINLRNRGAGIPDGGLFTRDQFQKASDAEPMAGTLPARGAIEVKGTADDASTTADSEQVARYWETYGQVLVTNYRDFFLVGRDAEGSRTILESYHLADSEAVFWKAAANPRKMSQAHGERFEEYLKRVMLYAAPIVTPKDVAWFLASYARDAKVRVEDAGDLPALTGVRTALEEALGLKFEGEKGEHFFRSTLVQTLFYGVFSAWVLWSRSHQQEGDAKFNWKLSADYLRVPILRKLFYTLAEPGQLDELNLPEVLDWAGEVLNRVDRTIFFGQFDEGHAVQYFYEPFLEAFDPELRKELGVWYTPPEIVQYMVARVDTVLKEELDIRDGLADPNVYVLDPCCGTGAYLREVLKHIAGTMQERGGDALLGEDLKRAAMERVFGFEIMPAPFVVAHLQLGLLMQEYGAPFSEEKGERPGVYLTNALTGWEPPKGPKQHLLFPEMEAERDAAEHVKRDVPVLVILGNPPYNGYAGMAMNEERDLTMAYRTTKNAPAPQGQGLNDLYVRFFRMAERRIVDKTGKGIVCFISNYSWLDGLSFTGMRERYLEAFDRIWIDCLNGDKYKTGKVTPDGKPDPSVFSTEFNREGIQVGTAISLLVRTETHDETNAVLFRHLWGPSKREELLETSDQDGVSLYEKLEPPVALGLPFLPGVFNPDFPSWPTLPELFPVSFPGVKTSRDDALVDIDRSQLIERMASYLNPDLTNEDIRRIAPGLMTSTSRFNARNVRSTLLKQGFLSENIVRYAYRPFDVRWLYWEPETKLLDEKRSEYFPHVFKGNIFLVSQQKPRREWSQPQVIQNLGCLDLMDRGASCIPLYLRPDNGPKSLFDRESAREHTAINYSREASEFLSILYASEKDLIYHVLAIMHAPKYREENLGGLRQNWPRIPLTDNKNQLLASAKLGRQIATLLDPESAVHGISAGTIRREVSTISSITNKSGGGLNPEAGGLQITVGWGHEGNAGVTMPGKGKLVERPYTKEELSSITEGASALELTTEQAIKHLGESTCDIYLNDIAYWKNIPSKVWNYRIGGYQVIKKWLSYRESKVLGRSLTVDEVREVTNMARRIAAILLLEPALDENYEKVKSSTYKWERSA